MSKREHVLLLSRNILDVHRLAASIVISLQGLFDFIRETVLR